MITGDHQAIARETARALGMGDSIGTTDGLPTIAPGEDPPSERLYAPRSPRAHSAAAACCWSSIASLRACALQTALTALNTC